MDPSELMTRYCAGDASAFHALYREVSPRLFGYFLRLTRRPAIAEDLCRATFACLHRARASYVRGADPLPWIYALAYRLFLDHSRARPLGCLDQAVPELAPLDALGPEDRNAFVLVVLEQVPLEQAAEITGTTCRAVRRRAERGVRVLRAALASA